MRDGGVMIFLTDNTVYEYELKLRMWRQVGSSVDLSSLKTSDDQ